MAKSSSTTYKLLPPLILFSIALIFPGCSSTDYNRPLIINRTGTVHTDDPAAQTPAQASARGPEQALEQAPEQNEQRENSLALASLKLTNQGRTLLENGKTDDAISVLEQSLGLDPKNGQSYYWLAEAWLLKQNPAQAEECSRLANLYLRNDPAWSYKIIDQQDRIRKAMR